LYLKARDAAGTSERTLLDKLYSSTPADPAQKIEQVLSIYKDANAKGYAEELKLVYKDLAISHLTAAGLDQSPHENLTQFANYLLSRDS